MTTRTQRQRWNAAWEQVKQLGVYTERNRMGCCASCAVWEVMDNCPDGTPVAWTFGGQGRKLVFAKDTGEARLDTVYINHSNGGAAAIMVALKNEGFDVEWNGDENKAVVCKFSSTTVKGRNK